MARPLRIEYPGAFYRLYHQINAQGSFSAVKTANIILDQSAFLINGLRVAFCRDNTRGAGIHIHLGDELPYWEAQDEVETLIFALYVGNSVGNDFEGTKTKGSG